MSRASWARWGQRGRVFPRPGVCGTGPGRVSMRAYVRVPRRPCVRPGPDPALTRSPAPAGVPSSPSPKLPAPGISNGQRRGARGEGSAPLYGAIGRRCTHGHGARVRVTGFSKAWSASCGRARRRRVARPGVLLLLQLGIGAPRVRACVRSALELLHDMAVSARVCSPDPPHHNHTAPNHARIRTCRWGVLCPSRAPRTQPRRLLPCIFCSQLRLRLLPRSSTSPLPICSHSSL